MEDKYLFDFNEFMKEHPEIDPSWKSFVQPTIQTQEDQMYSFIISYIFM